ARSSTRCSVCAFFVFDHFVFFFQRMTAFGVFACLWGLGMVKKRCFLVFFTVRVYCQKTPFNYDDITQLFSCT
ncbi:hypothetical protein KCA24_20250, partial [Escherichia coli]|nr:hypothetical protein [Escherichia coli]